MHPEEVILVNERDEPLGAMEKMEAHRQGVLHRAFSIFVFNSRQELLIHQRAQGKYHSAGLWTNTCCSHPRPGEATEAAAARRLQEEMGLSCQLTPGFQFTYKATLENGLTEHEFDHVYFGFCDTVPQPDPSEVAAYRYVSLEALHHEVNASPWLFTEWFKTAMPRVETLITAG